MCKLSTSIKSVIHDCSWQLSTLFVENKAWYSIWISLSADNSLVISSFIWFLKQLQYLKCLSQNFCWRFFILFNLVIHIYKVATDAVPITTKVVCFCRLLNCFRSLFDKQCMPRSDCSCRSSLIWVHTVCGAVWSGSTLFAYILKVVNNVSKCMQQTTQLNVILMHLHL